MSDSKWEAEVTLKLRIKCNADRPSSWISAWIDDMIGRSLAEMEDAYIYEDLEDPEESVKLDFELIDSEREVKFINN